MELVPGDNVDRYEVIEVLGSGGMATVYRVRHLTLGTPHALKVLTMGGSQVRDRLVQEGRAQAALQHPNIVTVSDVLDLDGSPGLVMEYIDGPTLDEWLMAYKPTFDEIAVLFRGILAGVGMAHSKGLIHRDLKPANVMLHVSDDGLIPKVADFGLVKITGAKGITDMKRTRAGMRMGTPAYMSPEQIRDSSRVDRRADLYSLGCILYEMICGETPYTGDDILAMFAAVALGEYQDVGERHPDLPKPLAETVSALLQRDVESRPSDASAVFDLLDRRRELHRQPLEIPAGAVLPSPEAMGGFGSTTLGLEAKGSRVALGMRRASGMPGNISMASWSSTASSDPTFIDEPPPAVGMWRWGILLTAGLLFGAVVLGGTVAGALFVGNSSQPTAMTPPDSHEKPDKPTPNALVVGVQNPVEPAPEPAASSTDSAVDPRVEPVPATVEPEPVVPKPIDPAPVPLSIEPTPVPVEPAPTRVEPAATSVEPAPAPVEPTPAPVQPTPEPVVPEPADVSASFVVLEAQGAKTVRLVELRTGKRFSAGQPIPPGTYRLSVDGRQGRDFTLRAGQRLALTCIGALKDCVGS